MVIDDGFCASRGGQGDRFDVPQPHPLPMPEYGGYFAPLTEYLPDCSQPISGFHRWVNIYSCYYNVEMGFNFKVILLQV